MALTAGTRLGAYEILAAIGAGGMGEVYRARDTKLNRDVALKVLPDLLAGDPDRLARFRREAQVLASLNHPNIAHLYGFEDAGDAHALVMELVEGPTLADLIAGTRHSAPAAAALSESASRGAAASGGGAPRAIELDDALRIARQIADALEAAHDQGIIHRDLKPANVKVRDDGTVKVLDFGLAKALDENASSASSAAMNSPTLTARATQFGMILGTAAYMAPEQARGRPVDRRADIWAFGVVLYEMLAGRRAFEGDDISITLASVLKEDVSWQALPADLPVPVRRLLRRCLEKDPKRRLSSIGDARLELDEAVAPADRDGAAAPASVPMAAAVVVPAWRRALPWAVAGVLGIALVAALVVWSPWRSTPTPTPRKLLAGIGADASLPTGYGASAILSPDGTTLAFVAQQGSETRLFIRKLDQLQAAPLAGTDGAANPFFSPDGQWLAFFAGSKLKKVSVTGGAAVNLCDAASGRGGTWADDDTIIFAPTSTSDTKLLRVSAAGGTPVAFGTLGEGAKTQRWPQALPGGRAVLYTEHSSTGGFDAANLVVAPLAGGTPKVVVRGGYYGRYVASGHLVYMQQGTLFAVPFDLSRLETIGQAVPAIEGLRSNPDSAGAQVDFSSEGTLAYVPGTAVSVANPIDWMTREGKTSPLRAAKADWANARFSPDGQKLALEIYDGKQRDIWVYEWARDTLTQLTFDAGDDVGPIWTPDGKRIVFASDRAKSGIHNLYWVNADGTGDVTRLTDSPDDQRPSSWHPGGKFLGFVGKGAATNWDLMILPMDGDAARGWTPGKPTVFLSTPAAEVFPMFSPDGRFIAYFSTEAGGSAFDVYVRPFPGPGGKWRVSTDGAAYPRWSATAHELLFLGSGKVMFAPYAVVGESFRVDKPQVWSPTSIRALGLNSPYDLHPDGKRLAVIAAQEQSVVQDKVVFMFNFFDYLRKIAPGKK
jgi:serine/threonine-protein kinase